MKRARKQFLTHRNAAIIVASFVLAAGIVAVAKPGLAQRMVSAAWNNTTNVFTSALKTKSDGNGSTTLASAEERGVVKGATTEDGQVSFNPESGLLTIPAGQTTGTINVTTYGSPAPSYDLRFSATGNVDGSDVTRDYSTTVKLTTTEACTLADDGDDPGTGECNPSSCYDANGSLLCPIQEGCHYRWPRCTDFKVLKVQKDRQCNQWLDCKSTVSYVDAKTQQPKNQCSALGVCVQFGPDNTCAQFIEDNGFTNTVYQSPEHVEGLASKIRWYSGLSSGFHFFNDKNDPDGRPNISGGYAPTDVREVGLAGGLPTDLVRNGSFEELRCQGGPRDRKSCIVASDCRVGQGVCTQYSETDKPNEIGKTSAVSCERDSDCTDQVGTTKCRYLTSWGTDVLCENPLDSKWVGVIAPTAASADSKEEAGWGYKAGDSNYLLDVRQGVRTFAPQGEIEGNPYVILRTWEDEENFSGPNPTSARYPQYSPESHLKEGNNALKVTLDNAAPKFSGVGVPLTSTLIPGGEGYVLSFRYRTQENSEDQYVPIKAQFGLNYEPPIPGSDALGFETTTKTFSNVDFGTIAGRNVCSLDPSKTCVTTNDCAADEDEENKGTCVDTTSWQEFVMGPVTIPKDLNPGYDAAKQAFLNFVSDADLAPTPMTFSLDDVSLKPALETGLRDTSATETVKIRRTCRLFPQDSSPDCQYIGEDGKVYKGWMGYCLDRDPKNQNLCLTWWPLEVLAGESPLGATTQSNYTGPETVYQCLEQQSGVAVLENLFGNVGSDTTKIEDAQSESWTTANTITKTGRCSENYDFQCSTDNDCKIGFINLGTCKSFSAKTGKLHWRDIERIDVFFNPKDDLSDNRNENSWGADCGDAVEGASVVKCVEPEQRYYSVDLSKINRVSGDEGLRLFVSQYQVQGDPDSVSWTDIYNTPCNNGEGPDILGHDDQWFAARFHFQNINNPDASDALLDNIQIKVCDDRDGHLKGAATRVVIRARSSCNALVQTVTPDANNDTVPEQLAWALRMQPGSYTDPKTGLTYTSDKAPYGAMSPAGTSSPTTWTWTYDKGFTAQPAVLEADPAWTYENLRAGTPYSYSSDPGADGPTTPKYCFDNAAASEQTEDILALDSKTGNACATLEERNACLTDQNNACVGRPVKHCSGNQLVPCKTSDECAASGYGSCVGSNDAGWSQGIHGAADAVERVKHVFGRVFGCWKLQSSLVDGKVQSSYISGCPGLGLRGNTAWDITKDAPKCPGNERPQVTAENDSAELCYVEPSVINLTLGGAKSGDLTVDPSTPVTARFGYTYDRQQGPMKWYVIEWERPPNGNSDVASCSGSWQRMPVGAEISVPKNFTTKGTFQPRVCIEDSWGMRGQAIFNGTITSE